MILRSALLAGTIGLFLACLPQVAAKSHTTASQAKKLEKLSYRHANPAMRGLVSSADQWPWSSFRYYHLNDASLLAMDHMP